MERFAIQQLVEWKKRKAHKPLIIRGARQVGKTWLMKRFASEYYDDYVYVNFDDNETIAQIFEHDFDIKRIIQTLELYTRQTINSNTLLIFDEIQEARRGVTALKYFCEKARQYDVIVAGSLLGLSMHQDDSFPVGKVEFLDLYPLNFSEFLNAMGESSLTDAIRNGQWQTVEPLRPRLENLLKIYFYVGGMPQAVAEYVDSSDLNLVRQIQTNILDSYENDFSKHAPKNEVPRIQLVWNAVIGQLAKENKKFIYGFIKEGARAKNFELAIQWLCDAGLIYRINRCKAARIPLKAYEDFSAFKIFMLDIGLMGAKGKIPPETLLNSNQLFQEFKGAITEQFVLQQLTTLSNMDIFYWSSDSQSELDFLIQHNGILTPIEVKAAENLQSKSLHAFVNKNPELRGTRFSMSPFRQQDWMDNIPLWACGIYNKSL